MKRAKAESPFSRAFVIDVWKDGTVMYRRAGEPAVGDGLPVFSVNSESDAIALQVRYCRRQLDPHPLQLSRPWFRLSRLARGDDPTLRPDGCLELEDLMGLTRMFEVYYQALLLRRRLEWEQAGRMQSCRV